MKHTHLITTYVFDDDLRHIIAVIDPSGLRTPFVCDTAAARESPPSLAAVVTVTHDPAPPATPPARSPSGG